MTLYAINFGEERATVDGFVVDTGMHEPVLLDSDSEANGCRTVPAGSTSIYELFDNGVGHTELGPFPLHAVIDTDGRFAYFDRFHRPTQVLDVLRTLLAAE